MDLAAGRRATRSDHHDSFYPEPSPRLCDKINQWTLLVGALPLVYFLGAGAIEAMPLDARQHEEFFLTAAQSVFAVALLLSLRLSLMRALVLLTCS